MTLISTPEKAPRTTRRRNTDSPRARTVELPSAANLQSDLVALPLVDLVALFKLAADETRLRIFSLLVSHQELHVRALCQHLDQSQPAVSHHLGLMYDAGLIERRRAGKHNFYRVRMGKTAEALAKFIRQLSA